jgi:hypothetical protein
MIVPAPIPLLMFLSPLGERLGEGVMQETIFGLTPSPNLSPKGERNMRRVPSRNPA